MKNNILKNMAFVIVTCYATTAFSAPPHWSHDEHEQSTWWAHEDTSQEVPLKYPYAVCGVGKHQSPIDLAAATISNTKN